MFAVNPAIPAAHCFQHERRSGRINSQIFSRTALHGALFRNPDRRGDEYQDQLAHNGKVTRGRIGVQIQEVNQALANSFGLPKPQGALVSAVEPGSPAERPD